MREAGRAGEEGMAYVEIRACGSRMSTMFSVRRRSSSWWSSITQFAHVSSGSLNIDGVVMRSRRLKIATRNPLRVRISTFTIRHLKRKTSYIMNSYEKPVVSSSWLSTVTSLKNAYIIALGDRDVYLQLCLSIVRSGNSRSLQRVITRQLLLRDSEGGTGLPGCEYQIPPVRP